MVLFMVLFTQLLFTVSLMLLLLTLPAYLEANLIFVDITPGLFVLLVVGGVLTWRRFRASDALASSSIVRISYTT